MPPLFAEIDLGFSSAETESAESPTLLTKGFFDAGGVREKILQGSEFLCLGYKGSGKSAISEHLRLVADGRSDLFVRRLFLADFPFVDFGHILRGSQDVSARYPSTWSWLLYLQLLASFTGDEGASSTDPQALEKTVTVLRRYSFIPTPGLHEIVLRTSEKGFRLSLARTVEGAIKGSRASTADLNFLTFVETLRMVAASVRSNSRHLLIIDGLDDVLLREPIQYDALAALVVEVARTNAALKESNAPGKVVVLCRTDIYDRLPGPNLNKIRQDSSIQLEWFGDPQQLERSGLIAVANTKARVSDPKLMDLIDAYLPSRVQDQPIRKYLLDRTRHLPRDFLQLLKAIQVVAGNRRGRISELPVIAGARNYSRDYLLPEIRDEVAGHFVSEERQAGFDALARLADARFTAHDFATTAQEDAPPDFDPLRFLKTLYDCGAVGNLSRGMYSFRYRNPHVPLKPDSRVILHRGLAPALSKPAGSTRS